MTPPPDFPHNRVAANLDQILRDEINRCGYTGRVYIPRAALWIDILDTYLEPDLMYLSTELEAQMQPAHWTRADIVVEIISPSNEEYDRKTKADTYQAMGIREMWLVDTKKQELEVRSFEANTKAVYKAGEILRSQVLPKIEIPISTLFA